MRRSLFATILLVLISRAGFAQSLLDRAHLPASPSEAYRGLALGAGTTIIDGTPYMLFHVAPQFEYGIWGFGFDGNIRLGTDGHLRKKDFDDVYDYLRWINYVSVFKPHDDFYLRLGGLEHATIGHGVIVNNYWNNSSYDNRRLGVASRFDIGIVGGEGLVSDLFRPQQSLIALRPFVRPFQLVPILNDIWLLHNIEIGVTGAFDFDSNATRIIPNREPYVTHYFNADSTTDSVVIHSDSAHYPSPLATLGADISALVWQSQRTEGKIYADYVRFQKFNDGVILGARTAFNLADGLFLDLRGERSLFKDQFLPSYYNSFYERDRFDDQANPQDYITKVTLLHDSTGGNGNGWRAGAFVDYFGDLQVQGSYLHLDNLTGKDWIELEFALPHLPQGIFLKVLYTRKNIRDVTDVIALDERSLMYATASCRPIKWLIVTLNSRWTFTQDDNGHIHSQSIFEPKFDVVISF